ncbi:hypothetical protein [Streptomyces sp. NPDC006925]|uniref:hypothetical protein n=1 Tax=Streptomyces sp. NPDC006925 TaxID=3364768 RepID=UPI0036AAD6FF
MASGGPAESEWGLAVDLGTSAVKAAYWTAGNRAGSLLPPFPSTVCRDRDGRLHTGTEALRRAEDGPECAERMPVQALLAQPWALLDGEAVPVADLIAALLEQVLRACRPICGGGPPARLTVVAPEDWSGSARGELAAVLTSAGLPGPEWVTASEAVAAAWTRERKVPAGEPLAVCDAGAGGLRLTLRAAGRTAALSPGRSVACGGADLDAALWERVRDLASAAGITEAECVGPSAESEPARRRARLGRMVTGLRETLSAHTSASLVLPGQARDLLVRRSDFEEAADGALRQVAAAVEALAAEHGTFRTLVLAGGVAPTPRLSDLLAEALGRLPDLAPGAAGAAVLGAIGLTHTRSGGGDGGWGTAAPYAFPDDEDLFG